VLAGASGATDGPDPHRLHVLEQPLRTRCPRTGDPAFADAEMGVAIEGSGELAGAGAGRPACGVDATAGPPVPRGLQPRLAPSSTASRRAAVAPRGAGLGPVERDAGVWVSAEWSTAPKGAESASLVISGPKGAKVTSRSGAHAEAQGRRRAGFIESDGYVSIEAEHYTRAVARRTELAAHPGHGRTCRHDDAARRQRASRRGRRAVAEYGITSSARAPSAWTPTSHRRRRSGRDRACATRSRSTTRRRSRRRAADGSLAPGEVGGRRGHVLRSST